MKKLFALLLVLTMVFALAACGDTGKTPSGSDKPNTSQTGDSGKSDGNGWFSDEVLAEMKLTGFTKPEGFVLLTDEELPDRMENDPYVRVIKGASEHSEYYPTIQKVFDMLKENYGEVYEMDVNFGADGMVTNYVPMPEVMYGESFYVKDGDTVRMVKLGLSSYSGVDSKVLEINFSPKVEKE